MNLLYYISNGLNQEGAFTKEELTRQKITKETLVWREGFEKWIPITNVSELSFLLEELPTPLPDVTIPPALIESMENNNAEVSHEEEGLERPDNVLWAIALYIITLVIGFLTIILEKDKFMSDFKYLYGEGASLMYNMNSWGSAVFGVLFLILIYNRQNWARIVYLVFFIIGLLFLPFTLQVASSMEIPVIVPIISWIINLGAVILLFTPSSNR